jgi:alkanesulfonate monooxygenase SsuD/methylene tetrahydromethanopterin reductase-like flavin-dependent oxidoreductase (luciferase family)
LKFCFFHFFPYTGAERTGRSWPVPTHGFDAARAHELYRTYVETMQYAEACGFDWLGLNEHHFSPYSLMPNCNIVGGALALSTRSAKLAVLGNLTPLANPLRVAEEYAMLDCMSGGRLIAGLMRGIPHEYLAYNIPPSESWERQREAVALILKAWTEPEPFGWEGKHFQFKQISIWPKPLQQPHPPIVISASSPESARYAGSIGASMGIVRFTGLDGARACIDEYKKAAREAGWEPAADNILLGVNVCVADSDADALAAMRPAMEYFIDVLNGPTRNAQRIVLRESRYFEEAATAEGWQSAQARRSVATIEDLIERGNVICGSPATAVAQIRRIASALDAGVFNVVLKLGNMDDAVVRRGMDLFRDEVIPAFRVMEYDRS